MPTYFCLLTVSVRDAPRSLLQLTEPCQCKSFTSMQLNQDNCADGAVDAAFLRKKR